MRFVDRDHEELGQLCAAFRRAVVECDAVSSCVMLEDFPFGSCGAASELLAQYLEDNGYGAFDYVLGEDGGQSHAWLEQDGLIVDITLDQFEDYDCAVFVSECVHVHSRFNGVALYVAGDLSAYASSDGLVAAYRAICDYLAD